MTTIVPTAVAACAARGEGGSPTGVSLHINSSSFSSIFDTNKLVDKTKILQSLSKKRNRDTKYSICETMMTIL
jgi:hypothetical protein